MKQRQIQSVGQRKLLYALTLVLGLFSRIQESIGDDDMAMSKSSAPFVDASQMMLNQIAEIRGHVARLQAAVQQLPLKSNGSGMDSEVMAMHHQMSAVPATLPGFPGVPHLYHAGSSSFFLEYIEKMHLTTDQKKALSNIQEKSSFEVSNHQRQIDQAEQELWILTASETLDGASIQSKLNEIARILAFQRIGFIRSVGEAARQLTNEQRQWLTADIENKNKEKL